VWGRRRWLAARIYAPVGSHEDLPYPAPVLENGANTSFVNRIVDEKAPIEELIGDPVARVRRLAVKPHPRIPLPVDLYGQGRKNAGGIDLTDLNELVPLAQAMTAAAGASWRAAPLLGGVARSGARRPSLIRPTAAAWLAR
jgi:RHH-type proline utilization regulon transcriptional repressor/proline dehydrogenase/delta 1-pyrroline-5-carboxylate dehydrogenase